MRHRLGWLLAFGALWSGMAGTRTAAADSLVRPASLDSLVDPVLIEFRIGRLTGSTMQAIREGDRLLVPLGAFFDLAEIRITATHPMFEAMVQPGNRRLSLNLVDNVIRVGSARTAIPSWGLQRVDDEWYLESNVLGTALDIRIILSWEDLTATVIDSERLPVGRRIAREKLRSTLLGGPGAVEADFVPPIERGAWSGMVLDYSILSSGQPFSGMTWSTALGANLLGGSLEVGMTGSPGTMRTDASWTGVWRRSRWLTQLDLGDALATGPRVRSLRGASLTNAPYRRPSLLGTILYEGALGPGWSVEAYRGGRLIAFDSVNALGRFAIDAPVQYGENPIDFVAYGPFGEVREFNQTYRARADQLPSRRLEYGASLGACRIEACEASGNMDVRYGVSPRWSLRAGVDQFWRDSLPDLAHPYASITGGIGNAWGIQLEAVGSAVLRSVVSYEPSLDARVTAEVSRFDSGVTRPVLTPDGRRSQWTVDAFVRPVSAWRGFSVEASLDRIDGLLGGNTSARLGVSAYVDGVQLLPSMRVERNESNGLSTTTRSVFALNSYVLPRPELGPVFGMVTARTQFETVASRPEAAAAYLSRLVVPWIRVEAGVAWRRSMPGVSLSLFLSTQLPTLRANSTTSATASGESYSSQFVQGSLVFKGEGRPVSFAAGPSLQRAGVSGRAFLDTNGNGAWDVGEETLAGLRVRAGAFQAVTDSSGEYRLWDLTPFEPLQVTVDSTSLASPLWLPTYAAVQVELAPNRFTSLDLPIVPGGVVEGMVLRAGAAGDTPLGGIPLVLRSLRTGERHALLSFSDGAFYAIGIKPGRYELVPDARVLERLGLRAETILFTMEASLDGAAVDGLSLRLTPTR